MTLVIEDLTVRFDATTALQGVSLRVAPGERLGVVGPNGAGKTTLLDVISGLALPAAGDVWLDGRRLTGLAPDGVARAGVGRTFQSPRLFGRMTVEENVRCGRAVEAGRWLAFAGLEERRGHLASVLTPGEGRRLELVRALAGGPQLLLLDEPCGGLSASETEAMTALLEQATAPGRMLILVEHKLNVIARLSERVVVLHLGEKIFDGPPRALRVEPRVLEAYLGRARHS